MVATAKFKRALDRVKAATPYSTEIENLLKASATAAPAAAAAHPLVRAGREGAPEGILLFTANRGLCGAFNTNVIKRARSAHDEAKGGCALSVAGKKGIAFFRFQGIELSRRYTQFDDKPRFAQAQEAAREFASDFREGRIRSLSLIYTSFKSAGEQKPVLVHVLPVPLGAVSEGAGVPPLTDPAPAGLLERLIPLWLELQLYRALVESTACEQVARRVAMKSATDNADEMIKGLTMSANRSRQAQITQEIAEIVGGAESIR